MKIGFACKIHSTDELDGSDYNFNTTTHRHLQTLSSVNAEAKRYNLFLCNIVKLSGLILLVANLPEPLRMLRLSGDLLPLATHHHYAPQLASTLESRSDVLGRVGEICREHGIRVSFHPGQFTVLGSNNEAVVAPSIVELEYHATLLTMMGYSGWHDHGCAINIHAGSKNVPLTVLRQNIARLSPQCQNFLTVENDEFSYGLDQLTSEIGDVAAIVPDLHHEWIYRRDYVASDDAAVQRAVDSWRGIRPKLHCAMSREEHFAQTVLPDGSVGVNDYVTAWLPDIEMLLGAGLTRSKLRQHSDGMWNMALARYYYGFSDRFDIMVEAKRKQVAARQLYEQFQVFQQEANNVQN